VKEEGEKVAYKTNVVKRKWEILYLSDLGYEAVVVEAESETAALMQLDKRFEVVSIEPMEGGNRNGRRKGRR